MTITQVTPYDHFSDWRTKTNLIATTLGDLTTVNVAESDRTDFVEAINKIISNAGPLVNLTTSVQTSLVAAINELDSELGSLSDLDTTEQGTLVGAINEVFGNDGDLSTLTTTEQGTLVGAINELDGELGDLDDLDTTEQGTLVGAINEVFGNDGDLSTLTTSVQTSLVAAINELDSELGSLSDLDTTEQGTLVGAINEVFGLHKIASVSFTVGSEAVNVIRVTAQFKDPLGSNVGNRANVFAYLSDNSNGSTLISSAHSGGWAIGTDGLLIPLITNKAAQFTTNDTGSFNIDITETGTKTAYLVVVLPSGMISVSAAITHAA